MKHLAGNVQVMPGFYVLFSLSPLCFIIWTEYNAVPWFMTKAAIELKWILMVLLPSNIAGPWIYLRCESKPTGVSSQILTGGHSGFRGLCVRPLDDQDTSHSSFWKGLLPCGGHRVPSGQTRRQANTSAYKALSLRVQAALGSVVPRSVTTTRLGNNKILPEHRGLLITTHPSHTAFSRPVWLKVNMCRKCIQWL